MTDISAAYAGRGDGYEKDSSKGRRPILGSGLFAGVGNPAPVGNAEGANGDPGLCGAVAL